MKRLRGFQPEAVDAVFRELERADSTLLTLATGTGKTTIAAEVIRRWLVKSPGARVLWLVQRIDLVNQARDHLAGANGQEGHLPGVRIGVEQGQRKAQIERTLLEPGDQVIVASLDSFKIPFRLRRLLGMQSTAKDEAVNAKLQESFDLVIVDEAHLGIEDPTYERTYRRFGKVKRVLLTATPFSSDGKRPLPTSQAATVAYERSLADAVAPVDPALGGQGAGDLVALEAFRVEIEGVRLGPVQFSGDDLSKEEAEKVADAFRGGEDLPEELRPLHKIAQILTQGADIDVDGVRVRVQVQRPALIFCPNTSYSDDLAKVLRRYGARAAHVDCYQTDQVEGADGQWRTERNEKLRLLRAGELDYLSNYGLLQTGVDVPICGAVVLIGPQSPRRTAQTVGRATRWCCSSAWAGGACSCGWKKSRAQIWDLTPEGSELSAVSALAVALAPGADDQVLHMIDQSLVNGAWAKAREGREATDDPAVALAEAARLVKLAERARVRAELGHAAVGEAVDLLGPMEPIERRCKWAGIELPAPTKHKANVQLQKAVAGVLFPSVGVKGGKGQAHGPWRQAIAVNQARAILEAERIRKAKDPTAPRSASLLQIGILGHAHAADGSGRPRYAPAELRTMSRRQASERITDLFNEKKKPKRAPAPEQSAEDEADNAELEQGTAG